MIDIPPISKLWTPPRPAIIRAHDLLTPKLGAFVPGFLAAKIDVPLDIVFVDSKTGTTVSITPPQSVLANDLLFIFNLAGNASGTLITAVTPSGFTNITNRLGSSGNVVRRGMSHFKIAAGGETSWTGMTATAQWWTCLQFRPTKAPSSVDTSSWNSASTTNPSNASLPSGAAPYIAFGIDTHTSAPGQSWSGATEDGTVSVGDINLKYKVFSVGGSAITIDWTPTTVVHTQHYGRLDLS